MIQRFTKKKNPLIYNYHLHFAHLSRVKVKKDLGVYLDAELSFVHHVDKTASSAYRQLGFVLRISDGLLIQLLLNPCILH